MSELRFRRLEATKADLDLVTNAFALNGSQREVSLTRWQHDLNPAGAPIVELAETLTINPPATAAIYATLRGKIRVDGNVRAGVQSIDTLTDARFRGQGLFRELANKAYSRCISDGVGLVYGFPNSNSAHAFFNRLEWTCLDPVPFRIRPLRARYLLDRIPGLRRFISYLPDFNLYQPNHRFTSKKAGIKRLQEPRFGTEHGDLWDSFAGSDTVGVERSADYLTWRFSKPGESYQMAECRQNGELTGYVVWTVKEKHEGRIGYIMELLHEPSQGKVAEILLEHATSAIAQEGADAVLAWNFGHSRNHSAYRTCGYFHFPVRLRPIELHFGVRTFDQTINVEERSHWYLSYCDSDTV